MHYLREGFQGLRARVSSRDKLAMRTSQMELQKRRGEGLCLVWPSEPEIVAQRREFLAPKVQEYEDQLATLDNDRFTRAVVGYKMLVIGRLLHAESVDIRDFNKDDEFATNRVFRSGLLDLVNLDGAAFGEAWHQVSFMIRYGVEDKKNPQDATAQAYLEQFDDPQMRRMKDLIEHLDTDVLTGEIEIYESGHMDALEIARLMDKQPGISLHDPEIQVGDVIWWKDTAGHTGYYKVEQKPNEGAYTRGKGILKVEAPFGIIESSHAIIEGTFLGNIKAVAKIQKKSPFEFTVPEDGYTTYTTAPIERFGRIPAEKHSR